MKKLIILLTLIIPNLSSGQNLISNPSFEDVYSIPSQMSQLSKAVDWFSFNESPDLYSTLTSNNVVGIPMNIGGYQNTFHGDNYAGFYAYLEIDSGNVREYVATELTTPLNIGNTYHVSFYVSLSEIKDGEGNMAVGGLGALFTNTLYNNTTNVLMPNNAPHIYSSNIISDTINWINIQGEFIADSAYQYLAIGNFFDDLNTNSIQYFPTNNHDLSYYFIDSVTVLDVTPNTGVSEIKPENICQVYPNPINGPVNISFEESTDVYVTIRNSLGQVVISHQFHNIKDAEINLNEPPGIYYVDVVFDNKKVTEKVVKY
jgi:hypothetical protein